eukprot:scaffold1803_cov92-Amphora_coffeaeformis.AAC.16
MSLTFNEVLTIQWRIFQNATDGMIVGPTTAIGMGTAVTWLIGVREGWLQTKKPSWYFCARYGVAQVIPSLIWGTQPATLMAQLSKTPTENIYTTLESMPPKRRLAVTRLCALRGAVAGSVLLSQVVALMGVVLTAREAYEQHCNDGREPPLESSRSPSGGVVIRLAGRESNVTDFSLATWGRRGVFPIFEEAKRCKDLMRLYASPHTVPLFWAVDNGAYSQKESWKGLKIPKHWFFKTAEGKNLLVLEADATKGENDSFSLQHMGLANDLDLDLYEVAQGFDQLQSLARKHHKDFQVLRVLLVDTEMRHVSGGGREAMVRDYVSELNLSDIVIDARAPLMEEMLTWLRSVRTPGMTTKKSALSRKNLEALVILETPKKDWFLSIQSELAPYGYKIIDRADAVKYGKTAAELPVVVYEESSADTIHTIRQLVKAGIVTATKTLALMTDYEGTQLAKVRLPPGASSICSSHIYFQLLAWVRYQALRHQDYGKIQKDLDEGRALVQAKKLDLYAGRVLGGWDGTMKPSK